MPWDALEGIAPVLLDPLSRILAGTSAERVVDRLLRDHRDWSAEQRACSVEVLFGVGLWRRRLAAHLGVADPRDISPRLMLGSLLRDLAGVQEARATSLCAAALPAPVPASAFADRHSLPDWLATEIHRAAGEGADALADALNTSGPIFLRANTSLTDRSALAERLRAEHVSTEPCCFAPHGLKVIGPRPNLLVLESYRAGWFEVQDEGSQLLTSVVGAQPGEAVLDYCAGAGGKTLALLSDVGPHGKVHAVDPDRSRLERLRQRCARARLPAPSVHGATAPASLQVDRVLVDAPCSELGALRRGPDLRFRLDPRSFDALPHLQREILSRAQAHVRPGGELIYATCTFRREENEDVVSAFAKAHPQFEQTVPPVSSLLVEGRTFRVMPHLHGTDGFFAAVFRRLR